MSAVVLRTAAPSRANIAFPNGWSCVREAERTELEQKQRGWASACARGKREAGAHLRAFPQFVLHGILSYPPRIFSARFKLSRPARLPRFDPNVHKIVRANDRHSADHEGDGSQPRRCPERAGRVVSASPRASRIGRAGPRRAPKCARDAPIWTLSNAYFILYLWITSFPTAFFCSTQLPSCSAVLGVL